MPDPLRIGVASCFFHADPKRPIFKGKTLLYLEESLAHWLMAGGAVPQLVPTPAAGVRAEDLLSGVDALTLSTANGLGMPGTAALKATGANGQLNIQGNRAAGDANDFVVDSGCGDKLKARKTCTITVLFSPTRLGKRVASVRIGDSTDGFRSPHSSRDYRWAVLEPHQS